MCSKGSLHILWRHLGFVFCLIALTSSLGGHLVALQGAAWAQMFFKNSQHLSLGKAIEATFDGKHPCRICHYVEKEQASDRRDSKIAVSDARVSDFNIPQISVVIRSAFSLRVTYYFPAETRLLPFSHTPPVPPPQRMS